MTSKSLTVRAASRRWSGWTAAVCAIALTAGCGNSLRDRKHPVLLTRGDAASYVIQALESPLADERRAAANRLAKSRHIDDAEVVKALCLVAQKDSSHSVQAAAVLALSRCAAREAQEACIEVLAARETEVLATRAPRDARSIAADNLHMWTQSAALPDDLQDIVFDLAIRLLLSDTNRNVRVAVAQILGYSATREAVDALIESLAQRDFGVCHESERSLMRLTGHTFDHDPHRWREYVSEASDLFADRGKFDDRLDPKPEGWLGWMGGKDER